MNIHVIRRSLIVALSAGTLFIQGCAATTQIEPIAAETAGLVAEVEFGLEIQQIALLIHYVDNEDFPEVDAWADTWTELITALRLLIRYSIYLIEIAEDPDAGDSRDRLADDLEKLYSGLRELPTMASKLRPVDIDAVLANVRAEEKFTDAAKATAPAIEAVVDGLNELTTRNARELDAAAEEFRLRIDAYHADTVRYRDVIAERRNATARQLELLDIAFRTGDLDAWNELRGSDPELQSELKGTNSPTITATNKAESVLMRNLATLDTLRTSLEPDFTLYQAELVELRTVVQSVDEALTVAALSVDSWERSHNLFIAGKKTGFGALTAALTTYAVAKSYRRII